MFPGGSESEESACKARDPGLTLESGRSPGEGNAYPLQCSCLASPWTGELVCSSPWGHKEVEELMAKLDWRRTGKSSPRAAE